MVLKLSLARLFPYCKEGKYALLFKVFWGRWKNYLAYDFVLIFIMLLSVRNVFWCLLSVLMWQVKEFRIVWLLKILDFGSLHISSINCWIDQLCRVWNFWGVWLDLLSYKIIKLVAFFLFLVEVIIMVWCMVWMKCQSSLWIVWLKHCFLVSRN